ncbi:MAG: HDOD domain-containing protein [Pseudomonadota bacterium]
MGWIGKLFSGEEEAAKSGPVSTPKAAPAAGAAQPASAAEIDAVYFRWLAAVGPQVASAPTEQLIVDELTRLAQSPVAGAALVPRVPAIIPQLMRTLRDDDMNAAELSRQLSQDLVLVAEVYREANRPCYRPRYHNSPPINSVEGAIMLLGQNGMRMLLARVAFRPIMSMQSGALAKRTAPLIWRQSEHCAMAGSLLAPSLRANAFESYLAGLMANVGLVVAFRVIDQMHAGDALPQSDAFIVSLFGQAQTLSARIAELWEFPETVNGAIDLAGRPDAPPLAQTLALSDRVSKLRMLVDATLVAADDPFVVSGLGKVALACFDKLQEDEE